MSEMPEWFDGRAASDAGDQSPPEPATTGDESVDAVVDSLRGLDDLPVSEHVAVFEQAHEHLRQVLSGAGDPGRTSAASRG